MEVEPVKKVDWMREEVLEREGKQQSREAGTILSRVGERLELEEMEPVWESGGREVSPRV